MDIGLAIQSMRDSHGVRRKEWNNYFQHAYIDKKYGECVFVRDVEGGLRKWEFSQADILAEDWYTV